MSRTLARFAPAFASILLIACPGEDVIQEDAQVSANDANADAGEGADVAIMDVPDGDAGEVPDTGEADAGFDPNCMGCRADGDTCVSSINCTPGSICNTPDDPLNDPVLPEGVCIRVVCTVDSDCPPPRTCTLEGLCREPICQGDGECAPGEVCRGGDCTPPANPLDAVDCNVLTDRFTLLTDEHRALFGIARNANGVPLVGLHFEWTSSDPRVMHIQDQDVVGGRLPGLVTVTARVLGNPGVMCNGMAQLVNLAPRRAGTTRIALMSNDTGGPIVATPVFLETLTSSGAVMRNTLTSTLGEAVFDGEDPVLSITVAQHPDFDPMALLQPGTIDVLMVVRRAHPRTLQGGLRGMINGANVRRRELHQGIAGSTLKAELSDLGLRKMLCDPVATDVDAPELSLQDTIDMPGNAVVGLGTNIFTDDSAGRMTRCSDGGPSASQLGCYVLPTERGHNAPWALAGSFRIAEVLPFAALANEPSFFCGTMSPLPYGLPWLFRTMEHGVNLRSDVLGEVEKINRPNQVGKCTNPELPDYDTICQPDYARFNRADLTVREPLGIFSRVHLPQLPARGATEGCLDGTLVLAGVELPERGFLPIGFGAGLDVDADGVTDCEVELPNMVEPFGYGTQPLGPSVVPLWMAPPHSGLEEQPGFTIAALSFGSDPAEPRLSMSARFQRFSQIGDDTTISGDYLPLPTADLDLMSGVMTFVDPAPASATYVRIELVQPDQSAVIFAPANLDVITLPNVAPLRTLLAPNTNATIEVGETAARYDALFTFGSGTTMNRWIEQLDAIAVEECRPMDSGCTTH